MRSSIGDGRRTGWTAVFDPDAWIRALLVTVTGVVSVALLACAVGLALREGPTSRFTAEFTQCRDP